MVPLNAMRHTESRLVHVRTCQQRRRDPSIVHSSRTQENALSGSTLHCEMVPQSCTSVTAVMRQLTCNMSRGDQHKGHHECWDFTIFDRIRVTHSHGASRRGSQVCLRGLESVIYSTVRSLRFFSL